MSSKWQTLIFGLLLLAGFGGWYRWSAHMELVRARAERGVLVLDKERVAPGVNLFASMNQPRAYLVDVEGFEIHRFNGRSNDPRGWHYVELDTERNLYAVMTDTDIRKINWHSNIVWRTEGRFHHDIARTSNGDVYSLMRKDERVAFKDREVRILNDYITKLSGDGEVVHELSLYDMVYPSIPDSVLLAAEQYDLSESPKFLNNDTPADIFHTNALSYIAQPDPRGIFQAGQLLTCVRELDLLFVIDPETKKIVWEWGRGVLDKPHHPTLLPNGNIIVFDNGFRRKYSRVLEVNPQTRKIVWSYGDKEEERFFSSYRGGVQRLPNGNTLITVGEAGEVFEITPSGEEVWRYRNPHMKNKAKGKRETIYRMVRIPSHMMGIAVSESALTTQNMVY